MANGVSKDTLQWAVRTGTMQRPFRGIYVKGANPISDVEAALAVLVASGGVASHSLAGILHSLDGVKLSTPFATVAAQRPGCCMRTLPQERVTITRGYPCADGTQTMIDLAVVVGDLVWEQALESALRTGLTTIADIEAELPRLSKERVAGVVRIRRVLALRPPGAPPTESLLETLMVQLIRTESQLPTPTRQVEIHNAHDGFVARVDLAYPEYNVFIELDGQQHKTSPFTMPLDKRL